MNVDRQRAALVFGAILVGLLGFAMMKLAHLVQHMQQAQ